MFYSSNPLDRLDHLRSDSSAVDALWNSASARVVPVWRNNVLVGKDPNSPLAAISIDPPDSLPDNVHRTLLGRQGKAQEDTVWFSVDYSALEPELLEGLAENSEFVDLRVAGPKLPADQGAILAYARALCFWQNNSRHCAICGHSNRLVNAGHVQRCSNPQCGKDEFPRSDPAVIMLVVYDDPTGQNPQNSRCLLGRNAAWPSGVYSTLAGFVEPGESLEAAVAREVKEESNIDVTDVQYVASQPWPFPRSIMLGFRARATSRDVQIDPVELDDAQWFSREQLLEFGVWGEDSDKLKLPRPDSIARFLIDSWINETEIDETA